MNRPRKHNRRQRKKLHLGEFRVDCFPVKFRLADTLSTVELNEFCDRFITMIENTGLQFGGGGGFEWNGIIEAFERGTTSEGHRNSVLTWLEAQVEVAEADVGQRFDGWYGEPWENV